MFIEQLDDEKIEKLGLNYLSEVTDNVSSVIYKKRFQVRNNRNYVEFRFVSNELDDEWMYMSDFEAYCSCLKDADQEKLNRKHQKNMYREFGADYLDRLRDEEMKPILNRYASDMTKLQDKLVDIREQSEM